MACVVSLSGTSLGCDRHLLWLDNWTEFLVPFIQMSLPRGCLNLEVSKCVWSSSSTQPAMLPACPSLSGSQNQAEKHAESFEVSLPCTLPKPCPSQVVTMGKMFLMNLSYLILWLQHSPRRQRHGWDALLNLRDFRLTLPFLHCRYGAV